MEAQRGPWDLRWTPVSAATPGALAVAQSGATRRRQIGQLTDRFRGCWMPLRHYVQTDDIPHYV